MTTNWSRLGNMKLLHTSFVFFLSTLIICFSKSAVEAQAPFYAGDIGNNWVVFDGVASDDTRQGNVQGQSECPKKSCSSDDYCAMNGCAGHKCEPCTDCPGNPTQRTCSPKETPTSPTSARFNSKKKKRADQQNPNIDSPTSTLTSEGSQWQNIFKNLIPPSSSSGSPGNIQSNDSHTQTGNKPTGNRKIK